MVRVGIHIFRKDLRIEDNLALNELSKYVDQVIGVFIFDPTQIKQGSSNKSYYSIRAAQFVVDCVDDLNIQCNKKLIITYGNPTSVIESLIKSINPAAISFNADFTPYSIKRDTSIRKVCEQYKVRSIINEDDQSLSSMKSLLKGNESPYMVFGTFYKNLIAQVIPKPTSAKLNWIKPRIQVNQFDWKKGESSLMGGRSAALKILKTKHLNGDVDLLITKTSRLSAYLNHGCISIRETYVSFKKNDSIESIRSIAWRDFFLCIYRITPFGNSYDKFIDERYNQIKWPKVKQNDWKRFMTCDTGFILVDAIMAELLQTGFINNRGRLILGTFWIKYLMISPFDHEYGSQVGFSRLLIDCSASQNKLNHQWIMGDLDFAGRRFGMRGAHPLTGRMIRVDNDMIKRFDSKYEYISKWLPQYKYKSLKECKDMMKLTKPMYDWRERYGQYTKMFDKIPRTKM
jgi:deoxyribodipyrimidine photo-lyase